MDLKEKILPIKALIMDVDGVLTDGRIIIDSNGVESKQFDVRDGHGLKMLARSGVTLALLTGRRSPVVSLRAAELGIEIVFQRCYDKLKAYHQIRDRLSLGDHEVAYIGDDVVDIPVLRQVGFAATVADADPELVPIVDWQSSRPGGRGAVRELCRLIMQIQGSWDKAMARYRV
ncbi:MAG: HAD hydrolase family protein [Deltaproteobacteria bacterium]|nr:HAD hydrolase family protein [Deltaproteobacteria bacterium]